MESLLNPDAGANWIKDATTESFVADVIEASRTVPVLVDFWAQWCGPCKTLGPALEKLVNAAGGRVRLVRVDVDQNQVLASQMGVQSIPMVFAFVGGRPVDYFAGAVPEGQIKAFIDRVVKAAGGVPDGEDRAVDQLLEVGEAALADGDTARAGQIFARVLGTDGSNLAALAGMARCHLAEGEPARAREVLALVPPDKKNDSRIVSAEAALALAEEAGSPADVAALDARIAADDNDLQARYERAGARIAAGNAEAAIDDLLTIVGRQKDWQEGAARARLIKLFDALGPDDPLTMSGRRRLSSILFA